MRATLVLDPDHPRTQYTFECLDERLARKLDALEDAILSEQPIEQLCQLYLAIERRPGNFGTEWI